MATRKNPWGWVPRALGVATAGYSIAIIARPALFTKPTGLTSGNQAPSRGTAIGVRALGGRDLASGLAMALAPAGPARQAAVAVRVGSDVVDLVLLGTTLPDRTSRLKAVGVAALWGALCATSYPLAAA